MRAHVLRDGLMVRSLERTGLEGLGSGVAGDSGCLSKRVRVPFGLRMMWRNL